MLKPNPVGKNEAINLDEILDEVGHLGRYQMEVCAAAMLTTFFYALCCAQFVFNTLRTHHRCIVPECEKPPYKFQPTDVWMSWALPLGEIKEQCYRKVPKGITCTSDNFLNSTQACTEWVYEHSNTIRSEFNMACREWMSSTVGTVHNAGVFTALFLTALISDTFGRKVAYLLTAISASVMGIIRSFSVNYIMYLIFEYLEAALGAGVYSSGYVLAMEMIGVTRRVAVATSISCSFSIGQALAAIFAFFVRHWQTFTRCIYIPGTLFVFYYFIVKESVRWLLSKGKKREAIKIIKKIAHVNKKQLSPKTLKKLEEDLDEETMSSKEGTSQEGTSQEGTSQEGTSQAGTSQQENIPTKQAPLFMRIIRSRVILLRISVAIIWWMAQTFVFYGINYTSVNLGANEYVSYGAIGIAEIPGYFLSYVGLDRYGRKPVIMSSFICTGLIMYSVPLLPVGGRVVMAFFGKALISCAVSSIYVYTMELFPTEARQSLHNFCSMIGRFGSMSAPQTVLLSKFWQPLPFVVFGTAAIIAGGLMTITPETLNTRMPDTIAEAEAISRTRNAVKRVEKEKQDDLRNTKQ